MENVEKALGLREKIYSIEAGNKGVGSFIKRLQNLSVGSTPYSVLHNENKIRVLKYETGNKVTHPIPVLMVPSIINRHYILDLMPNKSMVEYLSKSGLMVTMIEWGNPGDEDRYLTFDKYITSYIHRAVKKTAKAAGSKKVILLGYCLGGTMASIYNSIHPERVAGLINLTTPIDFHDSGLLSVWSRADSFDAQQLAEAYGNIPWPILQSTFQMLKPTMNLVKLVGISQRIWDDVFLDGVLALEMWGNDNVSMPGECYKTFINDFYKKNKLYNKNFKVDGQKIDLKNIKCPILSISASHDHIVPEKSSKAILELSGSKIVENLVVKGGHVGAVVSRRACTELWPKVCTWVRNIK